MKHGFSRIGKITKRSHALEAPVLRLAPVQGSEFNVQSLEFSKIAKRTQPLMSVDFYTYSDGNGLGRPCNFYQTNPFPIFVSLGVHSWFKQVFAKRSHALGAQEEKGRRGAREKGGGVQVHRRFLPNEPIAFGAVQCFGGNPTESDL